MEILKNFGFQPVFFVAQIINFLILFYVFKRFLYKPILKVLKDRQNSIAKGIEEAEAAKKALNEADAQKDEIIKSATLEAEKIILETRKNAEGLREELMQTAKSAAERVIGEAREMADLEFQKAKGEAREISLELSKKVLARVLDELFTKQEKEKILERNIEKLEKYD